MSHYGQRYTAHYCRHAAQEPFDFNIEAHCTICLAITSLAPSRDRRHGVTQLLKSHAISSFRFESRPRPSWARMLRLNVIGKISSAAILGASLKLYRIESPEMVHFREYGLLVRIPPTSRFKKHLQHPLKYKIPVPHCPSQPSAGRYPPNQPNQYRS